VWGRRHGGRGRPPPHSGGLEKLADFSRLARRDCEEQTLVARTGSLARDHLLPHVVVDPLLFEQALDDSGFAVTLQSINPPPDYTQDAEVIRPYGKPLMQRAGFKVLSGNLFDSAIMKTSVISPGAPMRNGIPQYPVPGLMYSNERPRLLIPMASSRNMLAMLQPAAGSAT